MQWSRCEQNGGPNIPRRPQPRIHHMQRATASSKQRTQHDTKQGQPRQQVHGRRWCAHAWLGTHRQGAARRMWCWKLPHPHHLSVTTHTIVPVRSPRTARTCRQSTVCVLPLSAMRAALHTRVQGCGAAECGTQRAARRALVSGTVLAATVRETGCDT